MSNLNVKSGIIAVDDVQSCIDAFKNLEFLGNKPMEYLRQNGKVPRVPKA